MPAKPKIFREIFQLRRMADAYPISTCDTPPHPRHQLILKDGAMLTFTRNRDNGGEAYYLSIKSPEKLPNAPVVNYLASLFFDPDIPAQELFNIRTPGVRCLRQEIPNHSQVDTQKKKEVSGLGAVYYKLWMFNHLDISPKFDFENQGEEKERVDANARRESFLHHALKLIDFLQGKKETTKDLSSADFTDQSNRPIRPIPVYLEPILFASINEGLSFSSEEEANTAPQTLLKIIRRKINEAFSFFFEEVHPKYFPTREHLTREDFQILFQQALERDRKNIQNFSNSQGTIPHLFPESGQGLVYQMS